MTSPSRPSMPGSSIFAAVSKEAAASPLHDLVKLGQQLVKPPPVSRDGLYASQAASASDSVQHRSWIKELAATFVDPSTPNNMYTVGQLVKALGGKISGKALDDRELLLEYIVQWLSSLAPDSPLAATASGAFISLFWKDLEHPPAQSLGDEFRFRMWDGSNNSLQFPRLGAANTPYAKSCSSTHPIPFHLLPDPAQIFDRVMRRRDGPFEEHPAGLSALFTAFATTVIHTVFRTDHANPSINTTSSYVDLSILYGHTKELVDHVRTHKNGLIHPDAVAEDRIFNFPPAVLALVVVFSRNHNFIAERLLKLNERQQFKDWDTLDDKQRKWQDDEIFGTARLINCGHYAQVVLHDYLRSILGLTSTDSTWVLDPRTPASKAPVGGGNVCAVEFNMLYRWHAIMSHEDAQYSEDWLRAYLPDDKQKAPIEDLTQADFAGVFRAASQEIGVTPDGSGVASYQHRCLRRGPDGKFSDEELAKVLLDATEKPAHAFGALSTPNVMRGVEIAGMAFARSIWRVCTLNECLETFAEFNPDPQVAAAFEQFYSHPDNIELYPGLICEATKPVMVGAGLCPGYTMSRAILSDAVALVRGDRFFTHSFDADHLTAWGLEDCVSDSTNSSYGGVLPKLFHRALPKSFRYNSLSACFPLQTTKSMIKHLGDMGVLHKYDTTRPETLHSWRYIQDPVTVDEILKDNVTFNIPYPASISTFTTRPESIPYMMGTDDRPKHDVSREIVNRLFMPTGFEQDIEQYFTVKTRELIKAGTVQVDAATGQLDIVRDVVNLVAPCYFADLLGIPLKTASNPLGLFTPVEFNLMLTGLFAYTALNFGGETGWQLRETSLKSSKVLTGLITARMAEVQALGTAHQLLQGLKARIGLPTHNSLGSMSARAVKFYTAAVKLTAGYPRDAIINSIIGTLVASCTQPADICSQAVDLYLGDKYSRILLRLRRLANQPMAPLVRNELIGFMHEAMRLGTSTAAVPRYVAKDIVVPGSSGEVLFSAGDRVLLDLHGLREVEADQVYTTAVSSSRPATQYRVWGRSLHNCVMRPFAVISVPAMMHEIFSLNEFRRAPGGPGNFCKIQEDFGGSGFQSTQFINAKSMPFPFPTTLSIRYRLSGGL